jgi:hypothetical protein
MPVEIFTKKDFENVLIANEYDYKALGIVQHNEAYLIDFGNPDVKIMVYSSVARNGKSREEGEDSIRAWLVDNDLSPVGGKTQKYVKRTKSWRESLANMVYHVAMLGRWIRPCPKCKQLLGISVKGDKAFVFCPEDAKNRKDKNHQRHIPLLALDKETGERIP